MTAKEFYKKYKGKYVDTRGKIGSSVDWYGNNYYMGQCATLARLDLVKVFGYTNRPYGNGKDFIYIPNGKKVSKTNARNGDIIVYPYLGAYGHVGMYYNGKVLNQNPHKATLHSLSTFGKYVIIRPYNYKGGNIVAKNKDLIALVEYLTEDGNRRRFNLYTWDKRIMRLDRGEYKNVWAINAKKRQVLGLKNGKWVKLHDWKNQKNVTVAIKAIKYYNK